MKMDAAKRKNIPGKQKYAYFKHKHVIPKQTLNFDVIIVRAVQSEKRLLVSFIGPDIN